MTILASFFLGSFPEGTKLHRSGGLELFVATNFFSPLGGTDALVFHGVRFTTGACRTECR